MVTRGHQSHATAGLEAGVPLPAEAESRHAAIKSEQARSPETRDWIGNRQHWLPLEEPAGHRESQCREADVKDFHMCYPLIRAIRFLATDGGAEIE
jgi:hypothetical protein